MKKRLLSLGLVLALIMTLLPSGAFAAKATAASPSASGMTIVQQTNYTLIDGVTETQVYLNNSSDKQVAGVMTTISPDAKATFKASYAGYYTSSDASERANSTKNWNSWKLQKTTEQAAAYESATGGTVIMAMNADYFNMQTGQPSGYLIMESNFIQTNRDGCAEPYFAVLKDGSYVIRDYGTDTSDVAEAISGPYYLVKNGANVADPNNTDLMPRQSIGLKADGTVVTFMADGRQDPYSVGMSLYELADYLIAQGVVTALYLDGGGSAMVASRHEGESALTIRNSPSDGVERSDSSTLLLVSTATESYDFDHATVSPNNEYYTPGSTVEFEAAGVSSSGRAADLPESGLTWSLDSESNSLGDIDETTGVFTSNGTVGTVTAVLNYNGKEVGSSSIIIAEPDEIYFGSSSLSLDFGERSDLGLVARSEKVEINFKDDDFTWDLTVAVGTMDGNTFIAASENSVTGTINVSYTRKDGTILNANISVEIGKMPVVAFDFEEVAGQRQLAAHMHWGGAQGFVSYSYFIEQGYTTGYYGSKNKIAVVRRGTYTDNPVVEIRTAPFQMKWDWDSYTPAADVFRANGYTYYCEPNGTIEEYEVGSVATVTEEEGGQVRFGDYSLALNFDYRSYNGTKNANFYVCYAGDPTKTAGEQDDYATEEDYYAAVVQAARESSYYIEGTPKSVGVWVYADESAYGFFLYTDIDVYTTDYITKTLPLVHGTGEYDEDGNEITTHMIDWTGWKYVTADLSAVAQYATEEHPLAIVAGEGLFWLSYQPAADNGANRTAGTLYFDNYRFVYGTDTDDLDNPEITGITVNDTEIAEDGSTVVNTGAVEITATFDDVDGDNKSGIDATATSFKIDGEAIDNDGDDASAVTRLNLTNGLHSVQVTVYDGFGNYSTETRYFTVNTEDATNTAALEGADVVTMGTDYVLTLKTEGNVNEVEMTVQQVNSNFGEPTVTATEGWTVTCDYESIGYKKSKMTISAKWSGEGTATANVATFAFHVPSTLDPEIDFFTYQVTSVTCTLSDGTTVTAAQPKVSRSLSAYYTVEAGVAVAGYPTVMIVTDIEGNVAEGIEVYTNDELAGKTDKNGQVLAEISNDLSQSNTFTVYAKSGELVSFTTTVTVMASSSSCTPVGIATVATDNSSTSQTITWFASASEAAQKAAVEYSTNADLSDAITVEGASVLHAFTTSKDAALINTVTITGLEPDTTYYYRVGDGSEESATEDNSGESAESPAEEETTVKSNWSDIRYFKTSAATSEVTKFFVVGDTQMSGSVTSDADEIALLQKIAAGVKGYDFGIQTGDYIDNGGNYSQWEEMQYVFGTYFSGIDIIHTNGNHEYFGDTDGSAAALIYNRTGDEQDYYSVEYGNVYVAVINYSADLTEALAWLVTDAQESNAAWKILSIHQPPYYTNVNGGSQKFNKLVPSAAEEAGINVVVSGHDHSYSRTQPMVGGEVDENNGIVYFTCGDLGEKSRNINYKATNTEAFNFAVITQDYSALYLDITATDDTLTIVARDADGTQIDTTTIHPACYEGHEFTSYDLETGKLVCSECYKEFDPSGTTVSGLVDVKDSTTGEQVYFINGVLQTGWTQYGKERYHIADNGIVHTTTENNPATCTKGGYITYTCDVCDATDRAANYTMPAGHKWATDENGEYILKDGSRYCSVCGTVGIDISAEAGKVTFNFGSVDNPRTATTTPNYTYQKGGVRPSSFGTVDGKTALTWSNDANLNSDGTIKDLYITWLNSETVGEATIKFEGRGDYYGEYRLTYTISPGNVTNLKATEVSGTTATLTWTAAGGAGKYQVYRCDATNSKGTRTLVATTEGTTCTVTLPDTEHAYYYVAAARTVVDGTTYSSANWSNILQIGEDPVVTETPVVTPEPESPVVTPEPETPVALSSITATVNEQTISTQDVDGETYLFLPSSADLSAVNLNVQVTGNAEITITGDKSSAALDDAVNVSALATAKDSVYTITVSLNGEIASTLNIMQAAEIPAVYLTSEDPTNAGRSYVEKSKSNTTVGSMVMLGTDGQSIYNGNLTQIKCRGNSTFTYCEKKSYQIKLGTKTDLLQTGEKVKTWVLLAAYDDATKVHDKTMKDLASSLGMKYVASSTWVDLYYDGVYCGIYMLGEKNSVGSTGVAITDLEDAYDELNENYGSDVTTATGTNEYGQTYQYTTGLEDPENITGGYLIELNGDVIDEANGFYTSKGEAANVKSPEWASDSAMAYISEYYQEFENAVYATDENGNYTGYNAETGKYYYEYCDKESLVQAFLLQEFALNPDGFRTSVFFYKDADGILYCGPVWDQELVFGTGWSKHISTTVEDYHYLAEALIQIPDFKKAVCKYYTETFSEAASELISEGGTLEKSVADIYDSVLMDNKLWPLVYIGEPSNANHLWAEGTTYQDVVDDMMQWIQKRIAVLDERFGNYEPDDTGDVNTGNGSTGNDNIGGNTGDVNTGDSTIGSSTTGNTTGKPETPDSTDPSTPDVPSTSDEPVETITDVKVEVATDSEAFNSDEAKGMATAAAEKMSDATIEGTGFEEAAKTVEVTDNDKTEAKEKLTDALKELGVEIDDNTEIIIEVKTVMSIEIKGAAVESGTKKLTVNITPKAQKVATVAGANDVEVNIGDGEKLKVTEPVKVSVPLPEDFTESDKLNVKHTTDDGKVYIYSGKVEDNVLTFNNPHGFSDFEIGADDTVVATIGEVGYLSLQDAVEDAEDGATIVVMQSGLSATTTKSVTVENGTDASIDVTINSKTKTLENGAQDTFTYSVPTVTTTVTPSYTITVANSENGTVSANRSSSAKGTIITLTVKSDEGYTLSDLSVTTKDGSEVVITDNGDGTYTFAMPSSNVNVTASFAAVDHDSVCSGKNYSDVDTAKWYHKAIDYVTDNKLMNGVSDNTFDPNSELTRAMLVTILYRLEGEPDVSENAFTDVADGQYYTNAVNWAAANGIVNGYGDGTFGPKDSITREQMAVILYNYAVYKGYDVSAEGDLTAFPDASDAASWAGNALVWAVGAELINGMDGALNPTGTATRAQVAQILMKFCESLEK